MNNNVFTVASSHKSQLTSGRTFKGRLLLHGSWIAAITAYVLAAGCKAMPWV